jgi:polar amino acid transport system substrate-binding protein
MLKGTAAAATLFVALAAPAQAAPLKVCTVDWPPYTVSEGRQVSGMHTDMISAVFQHLKREVQIDQIAWERCLKELETGGYDAAYSASFKSDRTEYAIYPKTALQTVSYVVVAAKGSGAGWDSHKDAAKLAQPIAAPRGFSVTADLQKMPGVTVDDGSATDLQDMQKLGAGRIKSVVIEASVAKSMIEKLKLADKVDVLTPEFVTGKDYFLIVSKKSGGSAATAQKLADEIAVTLAGMRSDGELDKIAAKY